MNHRSHLSRDGQWYFSPTEILNADNNLLIVVPSPWQADPRFRDHIGTAWYQRELELLAEWLESNRVIILGFGAVDYFPEVWLNGVKVGVDTGCLVAFQPTGDYDIRFIGGFKNALFGGEGLFMTYLRGPGLVYLQSVPFSRLADRIVAASRYGGREESRGLGGLLGAQEVDEREARKQKAVKRGRLTLDALAQLRDALLIGVLPVSTIEQLERLVRSERSQATDPILMNILDEIEVRAAVELAKLEMAGVIPPRPDTATAT